MHVDECVCSRYRNACMVVAVCGVCIRTCPVSLPTLVHVCHRCLCPAIHTYSHAGVVVYDFGGAADGGSSGTGSLDDAASPRVLLVREKQGVWNLPAGMQDMLGSMRKDTSVFCQTQLLSDRIVCWGAAMAPQQATAAVQPCC